MFTPITYRLLVAGLAAMAAGNASALTPADGSPELSLYIPGSQSNDPAFGFIVNNATVANALCLDNANSTGAGTTTHIYFHTAGAASSAVNDNYSAVYCYTDNTKIPGLTSGVGSTHKTRLWISRRRLGASYVGLDAVANGTLLTYLKDPITASCSAFNGSYSSGGATYQWNYSCATASAGIAATATTSDITPDVFHGSDNVTPGKEDINASLIENKFAIAGHIIGTPVTLKLRNALQYAQIQSGSLPGCSVGDESANCVPSLSKEQVVSIFTGSIANWNNFKVKVGGLSYSLPQIVAVGVAANVPGLANPLDTKVHICRRENGAGQQVALLATVLQYPCLGNSAPKLTEPGNVPNDVQYATSLGAVDKCLGDFNDGSNGWFGTSNPAPFPQPPATSVAHGNQWAISIQTTERNAAHTAPYRFIKINGALPTGEQVYLGHYPVVGETGISWNTHHDDNIERALNALVSYSQNPSTILARNGTLSNHSWGQAGYLALSANGFAPSDSWDPTNPVNPYTHAISGAPDACSVPVVNPDFGTVELR